MTVIDSFLKFSFSLKIKYMKKLDFENFCVGIYMFLYSDPRFSVPQDLIVGLLSFYFLVGSVWKRRYNSREFIHGIT